MAVSAGAGLCNYPLISTACSRSRRATSPYAHSPNGGNAANPYTSGWQGGNPYHRGGSWAPGDFNPWANNGTGSINE